ncbi:MAG TPA: hypothetical protein VLF18_11500 [Tahibacter sp.]|uniref:hypothetical protein n=1 Tax=Tahibacter sp. TaxID=2056211 RepID=UPI002D0AB81E|nr:hypothetical protein [Tahibacter sp.]HSX60815.1 hypothetical protein [Tahibacter sp.]
MIQALFVIILAAGAADCREVAQGVNLAKFGELAKFLPKLPSPRRLPPPGSGIVSFEIGVNGRALAIDVECQSSEPTGDYLKGLVPVTRFHIPAKAQRGLRRKVGLNVEVSQNINMKVIVTDFPGSDHEHK